MLQLVDGHVLFWLQKLRRAWSACPTLGHIYRPASTRHSFRTLLISGYPLASTESTLSHGSKMRPQGLRESVHRPRRAVCLPSRPARIPRGTKGCVAHHIHILPITPPKLTVYLPPGWKCCKPRVLTFEEFLAIPPCTTGTHSAVDDTPAPEPKKQADLAPAPVPVPVDAPKPISVAHDHHPDTLAAAGAHTPTPRGTPAPPPEDESDDPDTEVPVDATCRRRACGAKYTKGQARDGEKCVHHPGQPVFHEGSKGWSCCKRRVLEFDEFMKIAGCAVKERHLFVGRKGTGEEKVDAVR